MPATTADLTAYTPAAVRAIEFEASTWLHGDLEGARRMYDRQRDWARTLTDKQREHQRWGMWHANRLLEYAALGEVQQENAMRANHCKQAQAGYFYCQATPNDPCGPGHRPHDGHNGQCAD